jgi:hypothetical protein
MPTLTKSESSRINGAKSRGPVTPEGKQRSSMNAVKHGILAKSICLNIEKTEVFEELMADFCTRFQPADSIEMRLVEQAAMAQFRYERVAASTETAMFDLQMDRQAPEVTENYADVDPPTRFAIAFTGLANEGNSIQLMLRYQQTMLRQRDSAIKQLHEIRAKFPAPNEPDAPGDGPINDAQPSTSTSPQLAVIHPPQTKMPTPAGEHFDTPCSTRVMFMGESDSDGNATAKTCL